MFTYYFQRPRLWCHIQISHSNNRSNILLDYLPIWCTKEHLKLIPEGCLKDKFQRHSLKSHYIKFGGLETTSAITHGKPREGYSQNLKQLSDIYLGVPRNTTFCTNKQPSSYDVSTLKSEEDFESEQMTKLYNISLVSYH